MTADDNYHHWLRLKHALEHIRAAARHMETAAYNRVEPECADALGDIETAARDARIKIYARRAARNAQVENAR